MSLRIPYVDKPGIHGHGAALQTNPGYAEDDFVQNVLVKFYSVFRILTQKLFHFTPTPTDAKSPIEKVRSTLFPESVDEYVGDDSLLTASEKSLFDRLSGPIAKLKDKEIRALAVHSDARTIEALEYNASYWLGKYSEAARAIQAGKAVPTKVFHTLGQLVIELQDKAGATERAKHSHRTAYARGRKRLLELVAKDAEIKAAVEAVLPNKAEVIWERDTVLRWKEQILVLGPLTDYLRGLQAFLLGGLPGSGGLNVEADIRKGEASLSALRMANYQLPAYDDFVGPDRSNSWEAIFIALSNLQRGMPVKRSPAYWMHCERSVA